MFTLSYIHNVYSRVQRVKKIKLTLNVLTIFCFYEKTLNDKYMYLVKISLSLTFSSTKTIILLYENVLYSLSNFDLIMILILKFK